MCQEFLIAISNEEIHLKHKEEFRHLFSINLTTK